MLFVNTLKTATLNYRLLHYLIESNISEIHYNSSSTIKLYHFFNMKNNV